MANNIDILLLYEHVVRELDVACAVKAAAGEEFGLRIEFAQYPYGIPEALGAFQPRVVVLPFCYKKCYAKMGSDFAACLLEWPDAHYVNLAWEQLIYDGNRNSKTPGGIFATQHVLHHAWSADFAAYLQEQGIARERIFINGHPAYALYDKPYRYFFKQRPELAKVYELDPTKTWLFFPENYAWMFYSEKQLERFGNSRQTPETVAELVTFCKDSFTEVIQWCAFAAEREVEVILRPRPATPCERFERAVQDVLGVIPPGMHVIKEESVREWILASEIVVTSHSTSLIEAAVAGKLGLMLVPYPIPSSLRVGWHDYARHVRNREEFAMALAKTNMNEQDGSLEQWARSNMMANGDAIFNIARWFSELLAEPDRLAPTPSKTALMPDGSLFPALAFQWERWRSRHSRHTVSKEVSPAYENDLLTASALADRIERWRVLMSENQPQSDANLTS